MPEPKSYRRVKSLKPAFEILQYLSEQKEPVSGRDVAGAVGMPHGTAMCHLFTLMDLRMVRSVGGAWELDMGLALFWARKKAHLAGTIDRAGKQLKELEV